MRGSKRMEAGRSLLAIFKMCESRKRRKRYEEGVLHSWGRRDSFT